MLYDDNGRAHLLTESWKVTRIPSLDFNSDQAGQANFFSWNEIHMGKIRIPCSMAKVGDRFVEIDLERFVVLGIGSETPNLGQ